MDEEWLASRLSESGRDTPDSAAVAQMWTLLRSRAHAFAELRDDVGSAEILLPRRGLQHDESASFLRAVSAGIAKVDAAGFVTLPTVRQKRPIGRYALFSKSGNGISINLEYIVQIGTTAELVLDHGWPEDQIGFEQGEFDACAHEADGRVVLATEAKARAAGPDSLEKLVRAWMQFAADPDSDLDNNAGRKWRELGRLSAAGPVVVWLVADAARWILRSRIVDGVLTLSAGNALDLHNRTGIR